MRYFIALLMLISVNSIITLASIFDLPEKTTGLIGDTAFVITKSGDTLVEVARTNDLGFDEMIAANIAIDPWLPAKGSTIILPYRNLLPDAPHTGIVINVAEMRLYYFPKPRIHQQAKVITFPISVGRNNWNTPLITTKVIKKVANPVWHPPKSIREEHASEGNPLPDMVKPGSDNPLGLYALYLGAPAYLIHGTNKEFGIGMSVTHGCIRLYPEDIQYLYENVKVGTLVHIVNQPYKVGWSGGVLYLEVHRLPETISVDNEEDKKQFVAVIRSALKKNQNYPVDWRAADLIKIEANGLPQPIGPHTSANTPTSTPKPMP